MDRPVHHGRCLSPHPQTLDHRHPPSSRRSAGGFVLLQELRHEGDVATIGLKRHRDPSKSSVS